MLVALAVVVVAMVAAMAMREQRAEDQRTKQKAAIEAGYAVTFPDGISFAKRFVGKYADGTAKSCVAALKDATLV